ncbi:hypothetical protein TB2_022436 [Malus domestica]
MDQSKQQGQSDSPNLSPFVDPQSHTQHIPKLEDFLGDSSSMVRYSDSQTETHDSSSLTHMYDQSPTHVGWRGKSDGDDISLFGARDASGHSDIPEEATLISVEQQVSTFGLSLVELDIRQESDRHTDVIDAITKHLEIGSYREWSEERRQEWLLSELCGKRPLFGPDLPKNGRNL